MFEAGSIIWRIQTVGKDVLKQDLAQSEAAARKTGDALNQTGKKTEELGRKSAAAAPQVRTVKQELAGMSLTAQAAATTVGHSMVVIGAAMVATSALTVKAAIDWETAWTGVTKTVNATPEKLGEIEDGLRGLTKVLPASHSEIAAVAEAAGQLGVAADDVVGFTKVMIDLGETTNLSADEAATSLAQLMNIMQTAPEDVDRLGSAVVALGNNGASTERDIVEMSQRIAGAGKIIGLSEGETLGLANALASVGIEAQAGGSSVSNIMIDIANAVSQKGSKLLEWAKLAGMGADEFAKKYKTAPAEALALVIEGMGRLNRAGGDVFATLETLGQTDIRTTRSLLGLAGAGTLLRDSIELGNQSWKDNNALQIEAEKRYETTAAKLDMARNSIVDAAIKLGQHLLPAVEAVAGAVGNLSDFLGGMPPELQGAIAVLALLTGGIVLAGGVALLAVPKIVAFRQAVATLSTEMPRATTAVKGFAGFMGGPWGLAISLALIGITDLIGRSAQAASRIDELTQSLDKNTGAMTENTRSVAIKQLSDAGAFDIAKKYGVALDDVTDAALGNQDAYERVTKAIDDQTSSTGDANGYAFIFRNSLRQVSGELDSAKEKHEQLAEAQGEGTKTTISASDAYVDAQKEIDGLEQELDQLIDTLNRANGVGQDAITANIDYQDALAAVDEQIGKIKKGADGYAASLDITTAAGRDNMALLVDLADNAWDAAKAQHDLDGDTKAYRESLETSRATLLDRIHDLGLTGDAAETLADQILKIPDETQWTVIAETANAENRLRGFINSWDGKRINITVDAHGGTVYQVPGTSIKFNADGGNVKFFAGGGENHVAQFARAGDVRVWAEPETDGEWYFPEAKSKRPRSLALAEDMLAGWGFQIVPSGAQGFAAGGQSSIQLSSGHPRAESIMATDLSDSTIDKLARALAGIVRNEKRQGF
ncbi:phage tail tape measure protein [Leifsonia bigeumensis]|uniref:Phage tail tape measure protein n=1 Tax=Leifsonella bigeumensis TaxID=433643 RepID=A0ABP7F281_9MICO